MELIIGFLGWIKDVVVGEVTAAFWVIWGIIFLGFGLWIGDLWADLVNKFWKFVFKKKDKSTNQTTSNQKNPS